MRIEKPLPLEESDPAAADPFGERGAVALGERRSGQEGRWPVGAVRSRQEDAVGDGRVQMGVAVEPGAEAVEEEDGADSWAGGWQRGGVRAEQLLNLSEKNPGHRRDGMNGIANECSPVTTTSPVWPTSTGLPSGPTTSSTTASSQT